MQVIQLRSPAFTHEGEIPTRYTCEGEDVSPELAWSGIPGEAKSLVLIVDDPDAPDPKAPKTVWVHWVLYGMPPMTLGTPEGAVKATLPPGTREGKNDWKQTGWRGPCPPIGRHRYFFKLYALDAMLPDLGTPTRAELEKAMEGHVVGQATLMGYYKKQK
jgi:Raf kinase inhibitor-like YbhB/YbcL family protein